MGWLRLSVLEERWYYTALGATVHCMSGRNKDE